MKLENGTYIVGVVQQLNSEPWQKVNQQTGQMMQGVNNNLILANPYQDGYGNPQTEVISIEVQQDQVAAVQAQVNRFQGERCAVPVITRALKGGRTGAWLKRVMPKEAAILPVEAPQQPVKAAS